MGAMTVQQLLDALNNIEDKSNEVVYFGDEIYSCEVLEIEEHDEDVTLIGPLF